jgi:hypothetical protein
VHKRVRSGSPANEIIKVAKQYPRRAGRGCRREPGNQSVLVGSTAQRVQHYRRALFSSYARCPRKSKKGAEG